MKECLALAVHINFLPKQKQKKKDEPTMKHNNRFKKQHTGVNSFLHKKAGNKRSSKKSIIECRVKNVVANNSKIPGFPDLIF